MRTLFLLCIASLFFCSCNNKATTAKTFCDTACHNDTLKFEGNKQFRQEVTIGIKNCEADTLSWTHGTTLITNKIQLTDFLNQPVRLNQAAISCAFEDTSFVWLAFNDCVTGRGYLLELPYGKGKDIQKITGALNSFDKKFSVDPELRAFTDRGNIYVVNVTNGKQAEMTFQENYQDMDFNDIHKTLDSINVTKNRIYVKLLKNGSEVPLEKNISL